MIQGMTQENRETFRKLYSQFIGRKIGTPGEDRIDIQTNDELHLDTGSPHTHYENRTKEQMYNLAREMHIDGRSSMNKDELITAVREKRH